MDLERVTVEVRPRLAWEAIDLGLPLVRAWARAIYLPWLAVVLPVWVAVLVAFRHNPGWGFLVLAWLKPAWDVLPLFVVSRALFGSTPTPRETLAAFPRLLLKVAPAYLFFLERLDPARSFDLPVRVLEDLGGAARWRRLRVLRRASGGQATALTFACSMMESLLLLALLSLALLLVPQERLPDWLGSAAGPFSGPTPSWFELLLGLLWFVAVSVVEPFYVAAGFTLYLNRRTSLEGWDIELAFRRLARRLARENRRSASRAGKAAAGLMLALLLAGPLAAPCRAEEPPPTASTPSRQAAQDKAKEIADGPDFHHKEKVRTWVPREGLFGKPGSGRARVGLDLPWLGPLLEWLLWISGGLTLAWLVLSAWRRRGDPALSEAVPQPEFTPGVSSWLAELTERPLPRDVPGEARRLAEEGRVVEALSLLYRGALAVLVRRQRLEILPSWTESECLRELRSRVPGAGSELLSRLVRTWQDAAYAHRAPAGVEVISLCEAWSQSFGGGG